MDTRLFITTRQLYQHRILNALWLTLTSAGVHSLAQVVNLAGVMALGAEVVENPIVIWDIARTVQILVCPLVQFLPYHIK